MFESLLHQDFKVTRESSRVYFKTPAIADDTSLGISVSPTLHLMVILDGFTDGTGTVTVTGTDTAGATQSQAFTFPANGKLLSDEAYKTISRVQTSGLTSETIVGSLEIQKVEQTGELRPSFVDVGNIRGRLARPEELSLFSQRGEVETRRATIHTKNTTLGLQIGDRIVHQGISYEIEEIQPRWTRYQVLFRRLVLNELESPAE